LRVVAVEVAQQEAVEALVGIEHLSVVLLWRLPHKTTKL
jgi:hypothetical protein